jgi:hypothetical protein
VPAREVERPQQQRQRDDRDDRGEDLQGQRGRLQERLVVAQLGDQRARRDEGRRRARLPGDVDSHRGLAVGGGRSEVGLVLPASDVAVPGRCAGVVRHHPVPDDVGAAGVVKGGVERLAAGRRQPQLADLDVLRMRDDAHLVPGLDDRGGGVDGAQSGARGVCGRRAREGQYGQRDYSPDPLASMRESS